MNTLITLFIVIAMFSLVYWGVTQLALPPTVRTVIIVLMGLAALLYVYNTIGGGSFRLR
jgi:Na+/glutamate symporter